MTHPSPPSRKGSETLKATIEAWSDTGSTPPPGPRMLTPMQDNWYPPAMLRSVVSAIQDEARNHQHRLSQSLFDAGFTRPYVDIHLDVRDGGSFVVCLKRHDKLDKHGHLAIEQVTKEQMKHLFKALGDEPLMSLRLADMTVFARSYVIDGAGDDLTVDAIRQRATKLADETVAALTINPVRDYKPSDEVKAFMDAMRTFYFRQRR